MTVANTIAHHEKAIVTIVNVFIIQAPDFSVFPISQLNFKSH
jgi:hypothetical protein